MEQLSLFELEPHALVPIIPRPIPNAGIFRGDWAWPYSRYSTVCTADPRTSAGMLRESPFQVGHTYGGLVIEQVRVVLISTGWAWLLHLRPFRDFEDYWTLLRGRQRPQTGQCEECGTAAQDLITVDAQEPHTQGQGFTRQFCDECADAYEDFWTELWRQYYAETA